jgi:RNA polymerase sigma-70 factor (ECF subfamily)
MTERPSGDAQRWTALAAPLRAFVARRVPAGVDPDDIVQEVFLRVIRHIDELRAPERLHAWLFQIARNAIGDARRARHRRDDRTDSLESDIAADIEETRSAPADLAPCLAAMIDRLAEPYRTAIVLTTRQRLTQAEAAKRLGLSVPGMKSRVQRAREQLKGMLLQCCEVELDARRGVSDYHPRRPDSCGCADPGCIHSRDTASPLVEANPGFDRRDAMSNATGNQNTSTQGKASTCCGGPAPVASDACCVRDAEVKAAGGSGCGCGSGVARQAVAGSTKAPA